jgi:hypothetical protein
MICRAFLTFLALVAAARADLKWENAIQEFHRVPDDGHVEAKFKFTNAGADPITIRRVQTSCGCTSAKLDKNTFAPGESGEINVKFSFGSRRGAQRKVVSVMGDESQQWQLELRCWIHEPLTVTPALVFWRVGEAPEGKSVKLSTPSGEKVGVKSIKSSNPKITAKLETVRAGEEYVVNVKPSDTAEKESAELTIETDFPPDSPKSYRVFARIK